MLAIVWSVVHGGWIFNQRLMSLLPIGLLTVDAILILFGAFMITPIMSKIVLNIVLLWRDQVANLRMGLATAAMAVAREMFVLEHEGVGSGSVGATVAAAPALSVGYGLVANHLNES